MLDLASNDYNMPSYDGGSEWCNLDLAYLQWDRFDWLVLANHTPIMHFVENNQVLRSETRCKDQN